MTELKGLITGYEKDSIAILKNLIELHEILKLDGWSQDVARIKERIDAIKTKMEKENEPADNSGKTR